MCTKANRGLAEPTLLPAGPPGGAGGGGGSPWYWEAGVGGEIPGVERWE